MSLLSDSMLYAIVALVALLHQPVTQGKAITPFAGVYRVDQEPIDWNFPNFPIVPYGHYKFRIMSGIGNDMAVCLINEVHLIPKPTT
ncbi:hypothetical protein FOCC_FOCC003829 [Frankliniella occidentalis]|nr:hypothetical protein FOCC_FOCC003829 [Frankliniella occidentalis]